MEKKTENLIGRYRAGKMILVEPSYSFLTRGNFKDGFFGASQSSGKETEYDIINKEMIKESLINYSYRFNIVDGRAEIIR